MKRFVGAVLFGLGVLLLIFAIALPVYVTPAVSQLPYDLDRSTSVAVSEDSTYLRIASGQANIETGRLTSTVEVLPQAKLTREKMTGDLAGEAMVWSVYSQVRTLSDAVVSGYSTEFALDRRSAATVDWDGEWLDDGTEQPANYDGQVYKFPFDTQRTDYQVFDRDLRKSFPATFQEVTTVEGVEVYRFEQVVPEQPLVVSDSSLQVLLARFAPGATGGQVVYRNTRNYWVEPVTGVYVDVQDQPYKEFRPDGGGAPTVLLDADFRYDAATVQASADRAKENSASITLVSRTAPIGLGVLGAVLLLLGGWLVLSGPRPPAPPAEPGVAGDDPQPDQPASTAGTPAAPADIAETREDLAADRKPDPVPAGADAGRRGSADAAADARTPTDSEVDDEADEARTPAGVGAGVGRSGGDGPLNDVVPPASTNWVNGSVPTRDQSRD
ncbi:porin PorA family protein [Solwaraspora sp. WMMD1047]|uniref:DUF3068 domain-containing protein n=1 Tax=Solwaraspora sp. WMMD1047 TaxID=3016102 RepID=UPI0024167EE4|nr:porin PorA family protein [Solwaraspora sp. WMMD1047]MDG4834052.1 porin PorA family protein [Solwaraspora sp. WMMD1047]